MTFRRHHPRLARLLGYYVGSESQAQAMIAWYLFLGDWIYEDWIDYRRSFAGTLQAVIPKRHAVLRLLSAQEERSTPTPAPGTSPGRSSIPGALRSPGGS